ncbi:MAG: hemagglutinin/hemolysin-related protein [Labilithrix sp.]|nr:hemagglutinin/hemolysin-related protein [Labilithrix sp.]
MRARKALQLLSPIALVAFPLGVVVACGSTKNRSGFADENINGTIDPGSPLVEGGTGTLGEGGGGKPVIGGRDPVTCEEAAQFKTYVGCDYWPTVTDNVVADVFDFAVAVANGGTEPANVTVTGPNGVNKKLTVAGGSLGKVYLPWVSALKSVGTGSGAQNGLKDSVLAANGAYHLVSDKPVVVYQFNPLEFKAGGGEPGKDWSSCKITKPATECYSYSNDASLLLPSTAMTGNYRIMGSAGWSAHAGPGGPLTNLAPSYFAVTGTVDKTSVTVKLGAKGTVKGGGDITATPANGTLTFTLNAGDVAEVIGEVGEQGDFSGSLLSADHPVQVITGVSCIFIPQDVQACDHVEETVFPVETLGKHYVVMRPSGPKGNDVAHVVRFFGNADGTTLTYAPSRPASCPASLDAGQVADCGEVTTDFEVTGTMEFGIAMFQEGGANVDPDFTPGTAVQPQGDPSQSFAVTVDQYRKSYVFLAPTDYKTSYVDVVAPPGAKITLDGNDLSSSMKTISGTQWLGGHVLLGEGQDGVHVLHSSEPIGIQVIGYGDNTSYQYPAGLNLAVISTIPVK